jgi:hypothetical protein
MAEQRDQSARAASNAAGGASREDEENELEAEQESAEAMDAEVEHADVSQPPGASRTTEGQPS